MTFKVGYRIPDNSILRRGTLIVGVPKRDDADPMQPVVDQMERALRGEARRSYGRAADRYSASVTGGHYTQAQRN